MTHARYEYPRVPIFSPPLAVLLGAAPKIPLPDGVRREPHKCLDEVEPSEQIFQCYTCGSDLSSDHFYINRTKSGHKKRDSSCKACRNSGNAKASGKPKDYAMYRELVSLLNRRMTPIEFAAKLDIAPSTARGRLKKASEAGLIVREKIPATFTSPAALYYSPKVP